MFLHPLTQHVHCSYTPSPSMFLHPLTQHVLTPPHPACSYTPPPSMFLHPLTQHVLTPPHPACSYTPSSTMFLHPLTQHILTPPPPSRMTDTEHLPEFDKQFMSSFWNNKMIEDKLTKQAVYSASCRDIRQSSQDSSLSSFEESMTASSETLTKTFHLRNINADCQPRPLSDTRYNQNTKPSGQVGMSLDRGQCVPPQCNSIKVDNASKMSEKDIRRTQSDAELRVKPHKSFKSFSFKQAMSPLIFRKKKPDKVASPPDLKNVKTKIRKAESMISIPVIMETGFPATSTNNIHKLSSPTEHDSPCIRGLVSPLVHPRNSLNFPAPLRPRNSLNSEEGDKKETPIVRQKYQPLSRKSSMSSVSSTTSEKKDCVRHQPIIKSRSPQSTLSKPLSHPKLRQMASEPIIREPTSAKEPKSAPEPKPSPEPHPVFEKCKSVFDTPLKKVVKPTPPNISPKPARDLLLKKCIDCNTSPRARRESVSVALKPLRDEMKDILNEFKANKNVDTPIMKQKLKVC